MNSVGLHLMIDVWPAIFTTVMGACFLFGSKFVTDLGAHYGSR